MQHNPVITITSDWNGINYYQAAIEGYILNHCPAARIIDISHEVPPFNISQAAYILRNAVKHFPKDSIHIIAVSTEETTNNKHLAIKHEDHYYIGTDNGIFSLLFDTLPSKAYWLNNPDKSGGFFPELTVFADVACQLAHGKQLRELGTEISQINTQTPLLPVIDDNMITGSIMFIDPYKNAVTNISKELFDKACKNRRHEVSLQNSKHKIQITQHYYQTTNGELFAIFNSAGYLEIGLYIANALELVSLSINSAVRIKFFP